jgi:hypothetical protein
MEVMDKTNNTFPAQSIRVSLEARFLDPSDLTLRNKYSTTPAAPPNGRFM